VIDALNRRLESSPLRSVHGLSKALPAVSRSQLYLLLRGQAVIDLAEFFAICGVLELRPHEVLAEAEAEVAAQVAAQAKIAAYDEPTTIEEEQERPEAP